jgi:hypothetical protein
MIPKLGFSCTKPGGEGLETVPFPAPLPICLAKLKHAPAGWVVAMKDSVLQQIPGETRGLLTSLHSRKEAFSLANSPPSIVEYSRAG